MAPITWVLCGYLNMVEVAYEKEGLFHFCWKISEWEAWFYMCNKLGLYDLNLY